MSYETTRHAGLGDIRVPTLVVHHKDDTCRASPYSGAEDILKALKRAPVKELMAFEGGSPAISRAVRGEGPPRLSRDRGEGGLGDRRLDPRPLTRARSRR